jgi:hypothetical protein
MAAWDADCYKVMLMTGSKDPATLSCISCRFTEPGWHPKIGRALAKVAFRRLLMSLIVKDFGYRPIFCVVPEPEALAFDGVAYGPGFLAVARPSEAA